MKKFIEKASVLIEALPYIQKFRGETVVIKFGGSAMENKDCYTGILTDIAFMECVGMKPVIVHGGGKAITRRMQEEGLRPSFVKGLRVTDEAAIRVVESVMNEEINPGIVTTLKARGARARTLHGPTLLQAEKRLETDDKTGEPLDLGYVGAVTDVDIAPLIACLEKDIIPVITPLGRGRRRELYNINADTAAAAIAGALKARKLVFLSDVPGLLKNPNDPGSIISTLKQNRIKGLMESGVIDGGMRPKVQSGVEALAAGVRQIHIVDGRLPHSLLLEIFTNQGIGTEITHDD